MNNEEIISLEKAQRFDNRLVFAAYTLFFTAIIAIGSMIVDLIMSMRFYTGVVEHYWIGLLAIPLVLIGILLLYFVRRHDIVRYKNLLERRKNIKPVEFVEVYESSADKDYFIFIDAESEEEMIEEKNDK